jgi:hypothetical protein
MMARLTCIGLWLAFAFNLPDTLAPFCIGFDAADAPLVASPDSPPYEK